MKKQKVVSASIRLQQNLPATDGTVEYAEFELEEINKFLEEGYVIVDKIHSVHNVSLTINITFILEKEEK